MRDFLKRVAIGVAVGLSLFFLKGKVFAATVSLSNNQFQYTRHLCNIGELNCTDYYVSGYSNYGTWLSMPSQPGLPNLTRYYLIATYSQSTATLSTGNVYTFIFRTQLNPKDNTLDHINSLQYNIYAKVGSTWSDTYISTQSCSTRNVVTHDYAIETTCVFQVNTNATGILVRSVYRLTQTPTQLTLSNAQCFSSQNEIGAINEMTSVLKQMSATIINNFHNDTIEILDIDVDVSNGFNHDYSTQNYDNAESDLHSFFTDNADNTLSFDFTTWGNIFSWIFDKLTALVQLNAKVFVMITGFLTFSFVGLVFNR